MELSFFQNFSSFFFTIGCLFVALLILYFGWALTRYIFFGGDDFERSEAKTQVLDATLTLIFIMIIWAICNWLYRTWS